jgi:hypothetical protein
MVGRSVDVRASIERRRVVLQSRFFAAFEDYALPVVLLLGGGSIVAGSSTLMSELLAFSPGSVLFFLFLLGLPSYWIYATYRSYRLIRLDVLGNQEELRELVLDAVEEFTWSVMEDRTDLVIAYNRAGLRPGQVITIIPQSNLLYVSSRNRPGPRGRVPFSFGRDAENIRMLRAALAPEGSAGQALEP